MAETQLFEGKESFPQKFPEIWMKAETFIINSLMDGWSAETTEEAVNKKIEYKKKQVQKVRKFLIQRKQSSHGKLAKHYKALALADTATFKVQEPSTRL